MRTTFQEHRATWIAGAVVVCLLAASLAWTLGANPSESASLRVLVHDGAGKTHELPLGQDARLVVSTDLGSNTIVVGNGEVRIVDADCPNLDCTRQYAISQPGQQLICLPHRLWVEIAANGAGGDMDAAAVSTGDGQGGIDLVAR